MTKKIEAILYILAEFLWIFTLIRIMLFCFGFSITLKEYLGFYIMYKLLKAAWKDIRK